MKTALQELIDYAIDKYGRDSNAANDLICQAMILKKKEQTQIEDAYYKASDTGFSYAITYYEENYKQ